jgi:hypothetical protein
MLSANRPLLDGNSFEIELPQAAIVGKSDTSVSRRRTTIAAVFAIHTFVRELASGEKHPSAYATSWNMTTVPMSY